MALVNHVQLVINVQQLQIYQSRVKQENIGRTEINKYICLTLLTRAKLKEKMEFPA